jgi:ribosomal protein S18 acetylase RimI-like enzyme
VSSSGEAEVRFRVGTPADAPAAAEVQLESALTGFAHIFPDSVAKPTLEDLTAEWAQLLANPYQTVGVAEVDGLIVGAVSFGTDSELTPEGYGHLGRLYVRPEYSARGIGRELRDMAVTRLRSAGHGAVWLWVLEGNTRARAMYERRGWVARPDRRRTDWPGSGIFELGYALELGDPE